MSNHHPPAPQKSCYLVLEWAPGGELYKVLKKAPQSRLDEATAAPYVRQLAEALRYLHGCQVIHRDIKVGRAAWVGVGGCVREALWCLVMADVTNDYNHNDNSRRTCCWLATPTAAAAAAAAAARPAGARSSTITTSSRSATLGGPSTPRLRTTCARRSAARPSTSRQVLYRIDWHVRGTGSWCGF